MNNQIIKIDPNQKNIIFRKNDLITTLKLKKYFYTEKNYLFSKPMEENFSNKDLNNLFQNYGEKVFQKFPRKLLVTHG